MALIATSGRSNAHLPAGFMKIENKVINFFFTDKKGKGTKRDDWTEVLENNHIPFLEN